MIRFSFARPVYIDQRKQQTSPFIKMFGLHCMLDFLPWLVFYNRQFISTSSSF